MRHPIRWHRVYAIGAFQLVLMATFLSYESVGALNAGALNNLTLKIIDA